MVAPWIGRFFRASSISVGKRENDDAIASLDASTADDGLRRADPARPLRVRTLVASESHHKTQR